MKGEVHQLAECRPHDNQGDAHAHTHTHTLPVGDGEAEERLGEPGPHTPALGVTQLANDTLDSLNRGLLQAWG